MTGEILPPEGAFAPFPGPLVVGEGPFGHDAYFPHPSGGVQLVPYRDGLFFAWTPIDDAGTIALGMFIGKGAEFGTAATITHTGLARIIADLQSIHAQVAPG